MWVSYFTWIIKPDRDKNFSRANEVNTCPKWSLRATFFPWATGLDEFMIMLAIVLFPRGTHKTGKIFARFYREAR